MAAAIQRAASKVVRTPAPAPTTTGVVRTTVAPAPTEAPRTTLKLSTTSVIGNRKFDRVTWLMSTGSAVNCEDSRWTFPHQSIGLVKQLDSGVRGFTFEAYSFKSNNQEECTLLGECYRPGVYLCQTQCFDVFGIGYALPRQTLMGTLNAIAAWLLDHDAYMDVVTLFIDDHTNGTELLDTIQSSEAFDHLLLSSAWNVSTKGWPTLAWMRSKGRRLVIVSSGHADARYGVYDEKTFTVQTRTDASTAAADDCTSKWADRPLNAAAATYRPLYAMHFGQSAPNALAAIGTNARSNLTARILRCGPVAGRSPNFVSVDFVEIGDAEGVVKAENLGYFPRKRT